MAVFTIVAKRLRSSLVTNFDMWEKSGLSQPENQGRTLFSCQSTERWLLNQRSKVLPINDKTSLKEPVSGRRGCRNHFDMNHSLALRFGDCVCVDAQGRIQIGMPKLRLGNYQSSSEAPITIELESGVQASKRSQLPLHFSETGAALGALLQRSSLQIILLLHPRDSSPRESA